MKGAATRAQLIRAGASGSSASALARSTGFGLAPRMKIVSQGQQDAGDEERQEEADVGHVDAGRRQHGPEVDGRRGRAQPGDDEDDGRDLGPGDVHGAEDGGGHAAHDEDGDAAGPGQRPGDEEEQGQQDEERRLAPVEAAEDGPDDERGRPRFLEQVHEQRGGDEDEDDVEVGERALDDVPGRDAVPAGQRAGQGGGEERQLGRDLEQLGDDEGRDHDGQDDGGRCRRAHRFTGP